MRYIIAHVHTHPPHHPHNIALSLSRSLVIHPSQIEHIIYNTQIPVIIIRSLSLAEHIISFFRAPAPHFSVYCPYWTCCTHSRVSSIHDPHLLGLSGLIGFLFPLESTTLVYTCMTIIHSLGYIHIHSLENTYTHLFLSLSLLFFLYAFPLLSAR